MHPKTPNLSFPDNIPQCLLLKNIELDMNYLSKVTCVMYVRRAIKLEERWAYSRKNTVISETKFSIICNFC